MTGSIRAAISLKTQLIEDGSLIRIAVIPGADTTLCKTRLFVEEARGNVGFADFERDALGPLAASRDGHGLEQCAANTFAPYGSLYHDIFDLPLENDDTRNRESANVLIDLRDESDAPDGWRVPVRREEFSVGSRGPVRGRCSRSLQGEQSRNIGGTGGADLESGLEHGDLDCLIEPN